MIDRQTAVICTSSTFSHCCRVFQRFNVLNGKHRSTFTVNITFSGNEGSSECSHDTGNIRTYGFAVCDFLKTSENGIVIESSSLHNNMLTELGCVGNFDYFKQCVFDNGISKTGRNIGNFCALFLRLFYFGIHKYRTAGSEVDRISCK